MDKSTLIFVVIIAVYLSDIAAVDIVTYNKCSLGPFYRCRDLQIAKRCQAVEQCIQTTWEHLKLPSDNSKVCSTCMQIVQETRQEFENGTTQELIKGVLVDACSKYNQSDDIVKECKHQVDQYISELHAIFASKMDSQSVCAVTLFCNSMLQNPPIDHEAAAVKPVDSDICQDCKVFAVDAIATAKSMDRNVFKQKLVSLCNKLSGKLVRKGCVTGVKRASDNLYVYITTKMTPDAFCARATMCSDEGHLRTSPFDDLDDPRCYLCLEIVTVLKEALTQKEFKTGLFEALLSFCSWFGSHKQQCENYVKIYFDSVYELLVRQLDPPKRFCQLIDICTIEEDVSDMDEEEDYNLSLPLPINCFDTSELNEMQSSEEESSENSLGHSDDGIANVTETCEHCKTFSIDFVAVMKKLGRGTFKNELLKMCLSYHVPKLMCNMAIKGNGDKIYNDITTRMTPDDFCSFTTMCSNGFDLKKAVVGGFSCVVCQRFVTEMRDFLALNSSKDEIRNALLSVCSMLGTLEKQCTAIISDKYFEKIYKLVIIAMEPKPVCQLINFCENSHFGASIEDVQFYDDIDYGDFQQ